MASHFNEPEKWKGFLADFISEGSFKYKLEYQLSSIEMSREQRPTQWN